MINYIDFSGKKRPTKIVIFDASSTKWPPNVMDDKATKHMMAALECLGKIPDQVQKQYKFPGF